MKSRNPNNRLSEKARQDFTNAKELMRDGKYQEAATILASLTERYPEHGGLFTVLGDAAWDAGDQESALAAFRKAVELSPTVELPSLALFHCLWENGYEYEAFEEMKRFMSLSDSDEYSRLLESFNSHLEEPSSKGQPET